MFQKTIVAFIAILVDLLHFVTSEQYWMGTFVRLFPATALINWFYMLS